MFGKALKDAIDLFEKIEHEETPSESESSDSDDDERGDVAKPKISVMGILSNAARRNSLTDIRAKVAEMRRR